MVKRKKLRNIFIVIIVLFCFGLNAQQVKLWVVFKDKPQAEFDALQYFSKKNIERKKTQNLALFDNYDKPVNEIYLTALNKYCDSMTYVSRWLNAACIYTNSYNVQIIERLEFVREIQEINRSLIICETKDSLKNLHKGEINLLKGQTQRMQCNEFRKNNLTGKGVTIAIIDAGFNGYLKNPLIKKLRDNNQIKHTYDFIRKNNNVDCGATHGTAVLSCIGGLIDSTYLGCAYDANFLLYRTEKAFNEKFNEEEYWMAAMEEADKQGADIINTSLGYSDRRYFQKDMNGKKSLLSKAANIASRKGMLVVCSAGNEGDIDWKTICTPADADSALTVGAINPWTGIQASWSSYGPSSDKRIKPNVCAYGFVMAAHGGTGIYETMGTSFSSPLVAGFAACIRQLNPSLTANQLLHTIEESADLYPYYDYAHGYGVPQAKNILGTLDRNRDKTFEIKIENDSLKVILTPTSFQPSFLLVKDYYYNEIDSLDFYTDVDGISYPRSTHFSDINYSGSTISSLHTKEPGFFYYSIQNISELSLAEYATLSVRSQIIFKVKKSNETNRYHFYYKGYSEKIEY